MWRGVCGQEDSPIEPQRSAMVPGTEGAFEKIPNPVQEAVKGCCVSSDKRQGKVWQWEQQMPKRPGAAASRWIQGKERSLCSWSPGCPGESGVRHCMFVSPEFMLKPESPVGWYEELEPLGDDQGLMRKVGLRDGTVAQETGLTSGSHLLSSKGLGL